MEPNYLHARAVHGQPTQSSLQRLIQQAHHTQLELKRQGNNSYLASLLRPEFPAKYPDSPPSYTFTKQVALATDIRFESITGFTEEFRIIWATSSPSFGLFVERRSVEGKWYHHYIQNFAEEMNDPSRYLRYRIVSGNIDIQSSTLASGQFALNGILNGVKLAYAPENMGVASFDSLLPYSETPSAKRMNVSVAEGISVYYPLRNEATFVSPSTMLTTGGLATLQTNNGKSTSERIYSRSTEPHFFPGTTLLFECNRNKASPFHDIGLAGFINTYQQHSLVFCMAYDGPATGLGEVKLELGMNYIDADGNPVDSWEIGADYEDEIGAGFVTFTIPFFAYSTIEFVRVACTRPPSYIRSASLVISQLNPTSSSTGAQLQIIQGKGQDPTTSFRISGVANLEVIPGTSLKPDIQASNGINDDVEDLSVARNFLVIYDQQVGFNGVQTLQEKAMLQQELRFVAFERNELHNFAFIGSLMPVLRGIGNFAWKNGPQLYELGKELYQNVQKARTTRYDPSGLNRAMLNEGPDEQGLEAKMMQLNLQSTEETFQEFIDYYKEARKHPSFKYVNLKPLKKLVREDLEKMQMTESVMPITHQVEEYRSNTPSPPPKEGRRYNRAMLAEPQPQRFTRFQQTVIKEKEEVKVTSDRLNSKLEFKVTRKFPAITNEAERVQCHITVSSYPHADASVYVNVATAFGTIYVQGLASDLPAEVPKNINPVLHEYPNDAQRIITYGILFLRQTARDKIFINIETENNIEVSGSSFSFALEAILFDFPCNFNYSGDSHPALGFLPQFAMAYGTIQAKVHKNQPTIFKTVLSTGDRTEVPVESKITMLQEQILDGSGNDFPANSIIESSTTLTLFSGFKQSSGTQPPQQMNATQKQSTGSKQKTKKKEKAMSLERFQELLLSGDDKPEVKQKQPREIFIEGLDDDQKKIFKKFKVVGLPYEISKALIALKSDNPPARDLTPIVDVFEDVDKERIDDAQILTSLSIIESTKSLKTLPKFYPDRVLSAFNLMAGLIPIERDTIFFNPISQKQFELGSIKSAKTGKPIQTKRWTMANISAINQVMSGDQPKWKDARNRLPVMEDRDKKEKQMAIPEMKEEQEESESEEQISENNDEVGQFDQYTDGQVEKLGFQFSLRD